MPKGKYIRTEKIKNGIRNSENKGRIKKGDKRNLGHRYSEDVRKHMSDSHIGKQSNRLGKHLNEEQLKKHGDIRRGKIPWNKGIPQTEEQKKINSESHIGINCSIYNNMCGKFGKEHPTWKGGASEAHRRTALSRRELGFELINEQIDCYDAHHLTKDYVAYVPRFINRGTRHNVKTGLNMDEVNFYTLNYLFLVYGR